MTEYEALQQFHQVLVDSHDTVSLYGLKFEPAQILRHLDPTAYREMFNNWLDSERIELDD